MEILPII